MSYLRIVIVLGMTLCDASGWALDQAEPATEGYSSDPALIDSLAEPAAPGAMPFSVKSHGNQTNLQLDTPLLLTPYLGATRRPDARPDNMPPPPGAQDRNPLDNYHLEAGLGVPITDKANLNLGYRFMPGTSLIEERTGDPLKDANDLRFSFDIKLPFK